MTSDQAPMADIPLSLLLFAQNTSSSCEADRETIPVPFQYINQLDAAISQVYSLTFMYGSTCFGSPHAHHQELNNCSSSLWFYRWSVVVAVLLVVVGPAGRPARPRTTALLPQRSNCKTRGCYCSC